LAGIDQRFTIGRGAQQRCRRRNPHRCEALWRQPKTRCRFGTAKQALSKPPQLREIEILLALEAIEPCEHPLHRWRDADRDRHP
jgi:hypothetical protein